VGLIQIVVVLVILGVIMWLVNTYIPMPAPFKTIIMVVVVIAVCLWLLSAFGILNGGGPYIGTGRPLVR